MDRSINVRKTPRAAWFLAAAVGAFLIQIPPFPGIFLMLLLAPFWPGILIMLSLFVLVGEVAMGEITRRWLLVPAAYVLVYVVLIAITILDYGAKERFVLENDTRPLAWSGAVSGDLTRDEAAFLVLRHGVPEVDRGSEIVRLAAPPVCEAGGAHVIPWNRVSGYCAVALPISTRMPSARISRASGTKDGLPAGAEALIAIAPDGKRAAIHAIDAEKIVGFPMILAGCGLDSSSPAWGCFVRPFRTRTTRVGFTESNFLIAFGTSPYSLVLGIEKISPADSPHALQALPAVVEKD